MRIFALALCASLLPSVAWPCGNSVRIDTRDPVRMIANAERMLNKGRYAAARRILANPELVTEEPDLNRRRVFLLAVVDVKLDQPARGVAALREMLAETPGKPELETRLGEGLSRVAGGEKEALEILSRLEGDDMIVDAAGWVALARLRAAAGDATGAKRAQARCLKIAGAAACAIDAGNAEPHS